MVAARKLAGLSNIMETRIVMFLSRFLLPFFLAVFIAENIFADQIKVRYEEGLIRGFMVVRTLQGTRIADGENSQIVKDGVVVSHLVFRFKDGSVYDDTTTFTQNREFRLIKDHLVQKGPIFKTQLEYTIDATTGHVTARYQEQNKKPEVVDQSLQLPSDLTNGLIFTIVKDIVPDAVTTVSYLAFTPKPRLVKLVFTKEGQDQLKTDVSSHQSNRFLMKVDIGGVAGVVASIMKKKPADTRMWVLAGEPPSYAQSKGPLSGDGPVWKIELVSPRGE